MIVDGKKIEEVDSYVYLRQMVTKARTRNEKKSRTRMECILKAGQHHVRQKCANETEEKSI